MHVCLFRHATRDAVGAADGGLNSRGMAQARDLLHAVTTSRLPRPTHLLCSPKRRARETFLPLAEACQLDLRIEHALDERQDHESQAMFLARVKDWISRLEMELPPHAMVFSCSHLDVLAEMMALISTDLTPREKDRDFAPGEFRLFEVIDGFWTDKSATIQALPGGDL